MLKEPKKMKTFEEQLLPKSSRVEVINTYSFIVLIMTVMHVYSHLLVPPPRVLICEPTFLSLTFIYIYRA